MSEAGDDERGPAAASNHGGDDSATRMIADLGAYIVARLLLAVLLCVVIVVVGRAIEPNFPLTVAVLFAVVLAMPLGIWVFAPLRKRATASIAKFDERRRRDRQQLQARLRGEQ